MVQMGDLGPSEFVGRNLRLPSLWVGWYIGLVVVYWVAVKIGVRAHMVVGHNESCGRFWYVVVGLVNCKEVFEGCVNCV